MFSSSSRTRILHSEHLSEWPVGRKVMGSLLSVQLPPHDNLALVQSYGPELEERLRRHLKPTHKS